MLQQILQEMIASIPGGRAAIFLDGEGESIAEAGASAVDMRLLGAWKEIQLDSIRDIASRLGLGAVQAVLFSLDNETELIVPVTEEYCLLVNLSSYTPVLDALAVLKTAVASLKREIT